MLLDKPVGRLFCFCLFFIGSCHSRLRTFSLFLSQAFFFYFASWSLYSIFVCSFSFVYSFFFVPSLYRLSFILLSTFIVLTLFPSFIASFLSSSNLVYSLLSFIRFFFSLSYFPTAHFFLHVSTAFSNNPPPSFHCFMFSFLLTSLSTSGNATITSANTLKSE